jgi:hypothetical protein
MTGLALLLLAAAGSACGVWASLKSRRPLWAVIPAAALFPAAGVVAVVVSWMSGDGVVLPGLQLSPALRPYYFQEVRWGMLPWVNPWFILAGPLAHLLLVAARRDQASLLVPLPATAVFLWLFLGVADEPVTVVRARGPQQVAYLTVASREGGARLILAAGDPFDAFLRVLHVHDTASPPPELHLNWTNDGKALVVRVHGEKDPAFAVDLDGNVTGELPVEAREWPQDFVPPDVERRFSFARKEVFKLIHERKGLAPP